MPGLPILRLHRAGGLGMTKRVWEYDAFPEIHDWKGPEVRTIKVMESDAVAPLVLAVSEFEPRDGDITARWYYDANGQRQPKGNPPFAIRDMGPYYYANYIMRNAFTWLADTSKESEEYGELLSLCDSGMISLNFGAYFFGRWMKTGSAWLTGDEVLGQTPIPEDAKTLPGKCPIPRLVTAQMDHISTKELDGLCAKLFQPDGELDRLVTSGKPNELHAAYVVLEVLVKGTIWVLVDSIRQGRQNHKPGFSDEEGMRDVQRQLNNTVQRFQRLLATHHPNGFASTLEQMSAKDRAYHSHDEEGGVKTWEDKEYWLPPLKSLFTGTVTPATIIKASEGDDK